MPLQYTDPSKLIRGVVDAGRDLLHVSGTTTVRPMIGGRSRKSRKSISWKGGFVPSIMEGFVTATSKYITPMALMAMYKLVNRSKKPTRRK